MSEYPAYKICLIDMIPTSTLPPPPPPCINGYRREIVVVYNRLTVWSGAVHFTHGWKTVLCKAMCYMDAIRHAT